MTENGIFDAVMQARLKVNPEVLSLAHLAQYTSDDVGLECELLGLFKDQAVMQLKNIEIADCENDWAMAVHTLKGSARSIGAGQVDGLAGSLEKVGFAGPDEDKQVLTTELKDAVERCITTIETLV